MANFVTGGDEAGGVAGATGLFDGGDGFPGDFFAGGDDFADAGAAAGPEVIEGAFFGFEGEDVGLGEVEDVDVVADAGAVGGGVIGAEDVHGILLAEGDFEDIGDEMGFDAMIFAEFFGGPCGVEVAEGGEAEGMDFVIPAEDFFEEEFGFAVGIDGFLGGCFIDGAVFWGTEGGAGGGEDEFFDVGGDHGIEEMETADEIILEIFGGIFHGFADERVGGEVHDGVWLGGLEGVGDGGGGLEIADDEVGAGVDGAAVSFGEVIEDGDGVVGVEELFDADAADVAGAAGDEDVHVSERAGRGEMDEGYSVGSRRNWLGKPRDCSVRALTMARTWGWRRRSPRISRLRRGLPQRMISISTWRQPHWFMREREGQKRSMVRRPMRALP